MNAPHLAELLARRSELSLPEEEQVEAHLRSCQQCQHTADDYAHQRALLQAMPLVSTPPAIRAGVLERISHQSRPPFWRSPWMSLLAVGLAAVLIVAAIGTLHRSSSSTTAIQAPTSRPVTAPTPAPVATRPLVRAVGPLPRGRTHPKPHPGSRPASPVPPALTTVQGAPPSSIASLPPTAPPAYAPPVQAPPPVSVPVPGIALRTQASPTPQPSPSRPAGRVAPAVHGAPTPAPPTGVIAAAVPTTPMTTAARPTPIPFRTPIPEPQPSRIPALPPIVPTPTPTPTPSPTPTVTAAP